MAILGLSKPTSLLQWLILICKMAAVVIVVVLLGAFCISERANIGKIISWILGSKGEHHTPKITDGDGNVVGDAVPIKRDMNPFRDKSVVKLEDGKTIQLPNGVLDTDVDKIIIDNAGVYNVKTITRNTTDIFDGGDSGKNQ